MSDFFEFERKSSDGIRKKAPLSGRVLPSVQKETTEKAAAPFAVTSEIRAADYHAEEYTVIEPVSSHRQAKVETPEKFSPVEIPPINKPLSRSKRKAILASIARTVRAFRPRKKNHDDAPSLSEEIKNDSRLKLFGWGIVSGVAVLSVSAFALSFYFSRLVVTVHPAINIHELSGAEVLLDRAVSEIQVDKKTIPAETLEFSLIEKGSFPATGRKNVEDRARGITRIYNRFSEAPQRLIAQTRFVTDQGAVYRLRQPVLVPGAVTDKGTLVSRFVEAELIADVTGSAGNASGPILLKIPGFKGTARYDGFYAEAPAGFKGGAKGDSKVATKENIARAEEEVTKKVFEAVRLEIAKKIPPEFMVIDGLREIEITKVISPKVFTAGDTFDVEARAVGRVLVFRERDVASLLRETLLKDRKESDDIKNISEVSYVVETLDLAGGRAKLLLSGKVYTKSLFSERELAYLLQGKPEKDLLRILKEKSEIKDFSLSLFPPWIFSAPKDIGKIRVIIKEE